MLREYYNAARTGAAVLEKDWYGVVRLDGAERSSWLQGMVSNDVEKLSAGQGCYAAHLTPQGKMVALGDVRSCLTRDSVRRARSDELKAKARYARRAEGGGLSHVR